MSGNNKKEDIGSNLQAMFQSLLGTEEHTDNFRDNDRAENKGMAILSYIIPPIPFIAERHSEYVKFHSNQGMNLFVWYILIRLFSWMLHSAFPWDSAIDKIELIINLLYIGLVIFGVVAALHDKAKELPLVSKLNLINIVGSFFGK